MGRRWSAAAIAMIALGCNGRRDQYAAYAKDMCACRDAECVKGVDVKYDETLRHTSSWLERKLVSKSAEVAMVQSLEEATRCADKYRPPHFTCGGESGEACPKGWRCVMPKDAEEMPDAQGTCERIPDTKLKEGDTCIVPSDDACEEGLVCMTTTTGDPFSRGVCVKVAPKDVLKELEVAAPPASASASSTAKKK